MPIADPVWINAYTRIIESDVAVAITAKKLVVANAQRVAVLFSNTGASATGISLKPTLNTTQSFIIPATTGSLIFNMQQHAGLVGQEFWCIGTGASTIHIIEVIFMQPTGDANGEVQP